jgi:hypothetical protein
MAEPAMIYESSVSAAEYLSAEVAIMAGRLADMLTAAPVAGDDTVASSIRFLRELSSSADGPHSLSEFLVAGQRDIAQPLMRIADAFALSPVEVDLIILAGMAEEHEGLASCFRMLHPRGESRPTTGLAAQLFCKTSNERHMMRQLLTQGSAVMSGALTTNGDCPFFEQSLLLPDRLWLSLAGLSIWPRGIQAIDVKSSGWGLEEWLAGEEAARGCEALRRGIPALLLMVADDEDAAMYRADAMAARAGVSAAAVTSAAPLSEELERQLVLHSIAQGNVAIYKAPPQSESTAPGVPMFSESPVPVILCARDGVVSVRHERPVITIRAERLTVHSRATMWAKTLPELAHTAPAFANRYSLGPRAIQGVAADVRERAALGGRSADGDDVIESLRQRAIVPLASGIRVVHPAAHWGQLVLGAERKDQLREALDRLMHQARVLDDWGFLAGRPGARGVRMLFAGAPGTGKTLAAEVLAHTIGVDLLVVDLARLVSKWIGETEKNLASVFDAAEQTQSVLLFDEADALFGKRTEVNDAHDRYANLETAYLLARLERFDGLAILSTNLRDNIDTAFTRRLEFVVEFGEPSMEEREELWRCHVPEAAPLASDVRFDELASLYPIVGGLIRNASVAAGFMASAADSPITRSALVSAVRREYEKSGRAFPGAPADTLIG